MSQIEITWGIEDGYAGGNRPQHTKFELQEYTDKPWSKLSEAEQWEILYDVLDEEMRNMSYYVVATEEL